MKNNLNFLQSAPLMNELAILNILNESPRISQSDISKSVNLAASMVNNYIKKFVEQGYLRKQNVTNRDMQYLITDEGDKRRLFLLISYMSEVINLYKISKSEFEKRFRNIIGEGVKKVLFYGAGETGEVAIHAIKSFDIMIMGIVDDDVELLGKDFYGHKIVSYEEIEGLKPDAIIITSFNYQDEIYSRLERFIAKGIKILRI